MNILQPFIVAASCGLSTHLYQRSEALGRLDGWTRPRRYRLRLLFCFAILLPTTLLNYAWQEMRDAPTPSAAEQPRR